MKFSFRQNAYAFVQLFSLLMPLFGYMIDSAYRTAPAGFIVFTLLGILIFVWSYTRHKKTKGKSEMRAVDWISKGCTLQIAGSHQEAILAFTMASELEPGAALAYFARGRSYWELGNIEQAIKDFDTAIGLSPNFVEAYDRRGLCYARTGKHEQAVKDFDKAIELNHKYAMAYINRGASYEVLGNREQSIKDIQNAARTGLQEAKNILKSKGIGW
ncbi:MAG TPA: tetratricopeptide repeat protein [Syntrophales bacterium]|nr:tetratricopeptide repeat protein [Syntrophales bacterium]